ITMDQRPIASLLSYAGRTILFETSGNKLVTPEVRNQPRFTAPDGANTTFFLGSDGEGDGFPNFLGTSAAAPHAAGVGALMRQANPALTPAQIYTTLANTAHAITLRDTDLTSTGTPVPIPGGGVGFDADSGAGLIDAAAALNQAPTLDLDNTVPSNDTASSFTIGGAATTLAPNAATTDDSTKLVSATVQITDAVDAAEAL